MQRASSLRIFPSSNSEIDVAAPGVRSLPGDYATGVPTAPVYSPFGIAELHERRLRFGETATELSSFPEEDCNNHVGSQEEAFCPVVSWGGAAAQGRRQFMEDTHIGVQDLEKFTGCDFAEPRDRSFFGLFDGHGGSTAAEFARDNLLDLIVNDLAFSGRPGEALNSAFLSLDEQYYIAVQNNSQQASGSTLLAALLLGPTLLVANAGDSRAVLCKRGRAINLSTDHKPNVQSERDRIVTSGGYVCQEGFLNGQLGVSRGIGDFNLEGVKHKPAADRPLEGPLTAEPEISVHTLNSEDEFIVMACDGLWDVLPSQRVVEIARQCLQRNENNPQICAQMLVDTSMKMHASDNVTVMVVCLTSSVPPKRSFGQVRRSFSQNGLDVLKSALNAI